MKQTHNRYWSATWTALLLLLISITNIHAQPLCRIQHYSVNDGLSQSFVQRMVQSDDGLLWFGTWDGLNFACTDSLMQTRTTFRHFTTQDGLLSNLVHAMTDDGKGHYWVVAENGLTQLDPQTGLTVNYRSDRFGNELKFAETVPLLRGDTLLLGTNLGVLSLRLNELP